jgi:hypothetical protein
VLGQRPDRHEPRNNTRQGQQTDELDHGLGHDHTWGQFVARPEGEREWKLLKDKLRESRYSWDSTAFADGLYRLRVTLSDKPDNYPGRELTAQAESEDFLIDNTPPEILDLNARVEGNKIVARFRVRDALSALQYAEVSLNGGSWVDAEPTTRITDSLQHDYEVTLTKPAGSEFVIAVRAADERDNVAVRKVMLR